jgi:hypothetical protein
MQCYEVMRVNTATIVGQGHTKPCIHGNGNKYCCIGAQPGRAIRRVLSGLYRLKNGFPSNKWDSVHGVQECKSAQQATAREDGKRQENENKHQRHRCNAPGVREHESAQ